MIDNGALAPLPNDRQWSVGSSNVFRVSRGARRGVFDDSSSGGSSILNNRRIKHPRQPEDRSVPRFEYRYPQQQIHVIGSTAGRQQGKRPDTNKGKRPENNKASMREQPNRASGSEKIKKTQEAQQNRQEATIEDARGTRRARGSNKTYKSKRLE